MYIPGIEAYGIEIHCLAMTGGHEVCYQVKLRLGEAVPAPVARVEVQVTNRDEAAVEGGVGVDSIHKVRVLRVKPAGDGQPPCKAGMQLEKIQTIVFMSHNVIRVKLSSYRNHRPLRSY